MFERAIVRVALAVVLLVALGGVAFAVRASDGDGAPQAVVTPAPDATATPEVQLGALDSQAPIVGQPAPDFVLRDGDGELVRLSDLRGKVVFVNFWATWCRPCRQELPDIQAIYDEKRAEGLEVLAVNYQDDAASAQRFWDDLGLTLPYVLDTTGSVYEQYRLAGLPDSFFVDREGNIAAIYYGFLDEERMRERLATAGLP